MIKTVTLAFFDPLAPEYDKSVNNLKEAISELAENGMIKSITISCDEDRELAVKGYLKKLGFKYTD